VVGTFAANGSGGITAGTIDVNDADLSAPVANSAITGSSSYKVNVDGRGEVALATSPLGTITLDFVLQDSSHGLLTEFDSNATGSGTLDLQSTATPSGPYAFYLSGTDFSNDSSANPFATVGNFTVGSSGAITGLQDLSDNSIAYPNESLSGSVVAGPSSTPATVLASGFGTLTFDVFVIDSTHLKLIEMDAGKNLVGDAYGASSTTMPSGTMAFTLAGSYPGPSTVSASGGFIVTDGNGNITTASTFDVNNGGTTVSAQPVGFSGTYTAAGAGRYALALSSFTDGTAYVAYPFSGGVFLLEIDDAGVMSGAAYPQSQNTLAGGQGYGLNFTGANLSANEGEGAEVDEIAEFTANSSGSTITGVVDENYQPGGAPNLGLTLSGTYTTPDSNGRGQVGATAGNNSNSTLNGGFTITYYSVDGTTYPFIETDAGGGQIAAGVFFKQNPTASAAAAAKSAHPFVVQPPVRAHVRFRKPN
jgi:hypothetical protein